MPRNTSVTLGEHFADFVDQQVTIEALRAALVQGETSGAARPLDVAAFLTSKRSGRRG